MNVILTRNPTEYLRRKGIEHETAQVRPRLSTAALLVHTYPMQPPNPSTEVLRTYEGEPPPDRGITRPWPGQADYNEESVP